MLIETGFIAAVIVALVCTIRFARRRARNVWSYASWWERVLLIVAFLPIPGPIDELLGAAILGRITRRVAQAKSPV